MTICRNLVMAMVAGRVLQSVMPELPEVEITRRAIATVALNQPIDAAIVRIAKLRWDIAPHLSRTLQGARVTDVQRRGKYVLIRCEGTAPAQRGWLLLHLGMSGSVIAVPHTTAPRKHDHVDFVFGTQVLRLHDPRRFGALLWIAGDDASAIDAHPLIRKLGVEPLSLAFDGAVLYKGLHGRRVSIKQALLAGDVVVGVGNIYCSEALFRAGIRPTVLAQRISKVRAEKLAQEIRATLLEAIAAGGSTLRDFVSGQQEAGYFQINARVYGRAGQPCHQCGSPIKRIVQNQRATYFCTVCQR
jgi:formamidopyrimidine-DNA glycosylase